MEAHSVESLRFLSELDNLKLQVENVRNSLQQAEKLTKQIDGIEAIFSTSNFQQVTNLPTQINDRLQKN